MALRLNTNNTVTINGSNQFIDIVSSTGFFAFSELYTLMVTVNQLSTSQTPYVAFRDIFGIGKYNAASDRIGTSGTHPNKNWQLYVGGSGKGMTNQWQFDTVYHLTLQRVSLARLEFYVNGVYEGFNTNASQVGTDTADTIRLNGSLYSGQYAGTGGIDTVFDSVRLYRGVLTPTEILAEKNSRTAVRQTDLLCDVSVCAPGDMKSYAGEKAVSIPSYNRRPLTIDVVRSYSDLVAGSPDPEIDFFGAEKLILINGQSNSNMTVSAEYLYSRWKEWVAAGNAQYQPAFRTIGGDPIGGGIEVGAYFFLRNDLGWRIQPKGHDHELTLTGNLYPEDSNTTMFTLPSEVRPAQILIKQQVSSLTQAIGSGLSTEEALRLAELHRIHGLEQGTPLVVDTTSRTAGTISQTISTAGGANDPVTISRDP